MEINIPVTKALPLYVQKYFSKVKASPLALRLAKGALWSITGAFISRSLMFASSVLVARILGKFGYGEFGMVRSTLDMFGVFAGFGLSITAIRHIAEYKVNDPERTGRIIALLSSFSLITGSIMACCLYFGAPWLASSTIHAPHLTNELKICAFGIFLSAMNGVQTGALTGLEAFKTIAHVNLLVGIISFPVFVISALLGGLTGAVWACNICLGINWLFNNIAIRREASRLNIKIKYYRCTKDLSLLWTYSLPALLAGLLVSPVNWICNSILANQKSGFSALGAYSAAVSFSLIVSSVNNVIGQALLPTCVSKYNKNHKKFDFINIILPWVIGLIISMPFMCIPELGVLMFGKEYYSESMQRTIVFVMLSTIIIAHRQGIARNFAAGNYMWWSFAGNGFWAVAAVASGYFLRALGAEGRSAAFTIAYVLNTIIFVPFYINRKLCPRNLLLSSKSNYIWLLTLAIFLLNLTYKLSVYSKVMILIIFYVLLYCIIIKWWKEYVNNENMYESD